MTRYLKGSVVKPAAGHGYSVTMVGGQWSGPVFVYDKSKDKRNLFTVSDSDSVTESFRDRATHP